ncbi:MAG: hypothetical protein WCL14_01440 [Bacteroidota bacterium]
MKDRIHGFTFKAANIGKQMFMVHDINHLYKIPMPIYFHDYLYAARSLFSFYGHLPASHPLGPANTLPFVVGAKCGHVGAGSTDNASKRLLEDMLKIIAFNSLLCSL